MKSDPRFQLECRDSSNPPGPRHPQRRYLIGHTRQRGRVGKKGDKLDDNSLFLGAISLLIFKNAF